MGDEEDGAKEIAGSIGELSLRVQGEDMEEVSEQFDEKLERMLAESERMSAALRDGCRRFQ